MPAVELANKSSSKVQNEPWKGLGYRLMCPPGEQLTTDEIVTQSHLDWEVIRDPLRTKTRNIPVPGRVALIRETDGAFFDLVGSNWKPNQNRQGIDFFRRLCENGGLDLHTAGSVSGGKIIWAIAKMKDSFTLPGGDVVEGHLLFANPHMFAKSAVIEFLPIRAVSESGIVLSMSNAKKGKKVKVSHKTDFDPTVVAQALAASKEAFKQYEATARLLASKKPTDKQIEEYFNYLFPVIRYNTKKKVDLTAEGMSVNDIIVAGRSGKQKRDISKNAERLFELLESQPGADLSRGTWWHVLNTIFYITNHEFGRTVDSRLSSAWFGANRRLNLRALKKAIEMAGGK